MKFALSDIGQVISELGQWEKKYLPENAQAGKVELLDIVCGISLESVISWLEWNHHQTESNKLKSEATKILQWSQTTDGVFSQKDLDDNPFVADEKRLNLKLTDMLHNIAKTARKERNKYLLGKIIRFIPVVGKILDE